MLKYTDLISEENIKTFMKANLKMNLVCKVDVIPLNGLIFSKLNIDLQTKNVSSFISMDDETTAEYSEGKSQ